ncbi:hypothetical protein ACLMMQ_29915 [Bacillus mobilis]|uniref:hypothetical protein n=1 Tax=Bacillati TaxID=1783272 RepID=UPI00371B0882
MSDIAIRNDQQLDLAVSSDQAIERLAEWARVADAAYGIATKLCGTSFAPQAYRGKAEEATAAILAGAELGFGPMASLRAFDSIQGTPAPKAITLRAVVQSRGHDLEVRESDTTHCVVEGRRNGSDRWQRLEWTIERAEKAGYVSKNPKWKTDPQAMLVARATAEMARWLDSAAIMGMPYSAEELHDEPAAVRPKLTRVTAAEILGTPVETPPAAASDPTDPLGLFAAVDAPLTAAEILAEIADAGTQERLDEIKAICQQNGIRDPQVLDAWSARSHQLAEAA